MRYILMLLFMLIPSTLCGDELERLSKAIDYEMKRFEQREQRGQHYSRGADRGKLLKKLHAFDSRGVGFRPVITTLPAGIQLSVGVVVSGDRRYVRIGLSPMFSGIGAVHTFNFGR